MAKRTRILTAAATAIVCLHALAAGQEARGKCFLWKVTSKRATVYLLGSIHLCDATLYPLDPTIEDAFEKSDVLVLEIDLSPECQMKAAGLMMQKAQFTGQDTLERTLSKKARSKLKAFLQERGIALVQFNRFRPWYVTLVLTIQENMRLGYTPMLGVDKHFFDLAAARGKKVLALENVLAGGTKQEDELVLVETLERLPKAKELMETMVAAWLTGDAAKLDDIVHEAVWKNPKLKGYLKRLIDDRNVRMAKKIEKFLKTDKTYFVVVGSAHLVGKKGIPDLLQKKGHTVEQLNKTGKAAAPAKAG